MKKRLKHLVDRLRTATDGTFRRTRPARAGGQEPRRLDALAAPVRVRS